MKLIDTSAWIQTMRRGGKTEVRAQVDGLLHSGKAAWCAPVRLELWANVGRDPEAAILRQYEIVLPNYPVTESIWGEAQLLAERGRREGLSAPAMDILIAACARHHDLEVVHDDAHFDWLMRI